MEDFRDSNKEVDQLTSGDPAGSMPFADFIDKMRKEELEEDGAEVLGSVELRS